MRHFFKHFLYVLLLWMGTTAFSQENYTVNGNTYALKTELEGPLTLLWNVVDGNYRYFAKKNNEIVELINTRVDGRFQEEYKQVLTRLTSDYPTDASRVNLTLAGLSIYFNTYNKNAAPDYVIDSKKVALETRLGIMGGISNNNSTTNPQNAMAPFLGAEFEITDADMLKRHALVLQFRYSFETVDYDLTYSQFALSYRFKFIHTQQFYVFAQAKFAALTFAKLAEDNEEGLVNLKSTALNTPVGIGLGIDYKLGNGYLTFAVNDLVAPGYDTNGEFSVDLSLGYKFRL